MALRAVIFDYGMVLTGPPDPEAHASLVRITGLSATRLDGLYWSYRDAYDTGELSGQDFWRRIANEGGLGLSESAIGELNGWDARMWMTENHAMLAWQAALKRHGLLTAILSNMGDTVHQAIQKELDWQLRFDVLVWSYQLGIAKPDPRIYRYTLEKLGTRPEDTLFIDDRQVNVEAAIALGMKGIVFTDVEKLRTKLIAQHLDESLPLPAAAAL